MLRKERFAKCEKLLENGNIPSGRLYSTGQMSTVLTKPNHAICKHCRQSVRHHHKTLSVQGHLRKHKPFKKLMSDMVVSDCTDWWKTGINVSWAAQKPKMTAITSSKFSSLNQSQKSLKSFVVPNFNATEQKKFDQEIAMYFFCTGTSFMCRRSSPPP